MKYRECLWATLFHFCIALLLPLNGFTQKQFSFQHITVEDGLSQSTVYGIVQDVRGFMWFSTRNGLNRYDSREIKIYKNEQHTRASLNWSSAMLSDSKGDLWIGTGSWLKKYDPLSDRFLLIQDLQQYSKDPDTYMTKIYEAPDGQIWIGTNRGLYVMPSFGTSTLTKSAIRVFLPGKEIYAIKQDVDGTIWIGTNNGLYRMRKQGDQYILSNFKDSRNFYGNYVRAVEEDRRGNLWIGTDAGLRFWDHHGQQLTQQSNKVNCPPIKHSVRKITMTSSGLIWIGTSNGISVFEPGSQSLTLYENDPEDSNSLNQNSVYDVYESRDGTVWIGTYYGGVNMVYKTPIAFKTYRKNNNSNSLGSNIISSIVADDYNNLLIGTQEAGFTYFDRAKHIFKRYKHHAEDTETVGADIVKVIYKDKRGDIWFGSHYLQKYNQKTRKFQTYKAFPNSDLTYVSVIRERDDGKYWVATREPGLFVFDKRTGAFDVSPFCESSLKNKVVKYISQDAKGDTWFGTNEGLYKMLSKSGKLQRYKTHQSEGSALLSDNVNVIVQDSRKQLWIGTMNGGISIFNTSTGRFKTYTISEGLPSNNVFGILEDNDFNIWLSTDRGLSRFDRSQQRFQNFNMRDGLPGNVFNYNAFYKDVDGKLYFGSYNGLISFNPSEIVINTTPPPVVLTGIRVYNENKSGSRSFGQYGYSVDSARHISLKYNQNTFSVHFAVLNYIKPLKNKYAYKLEGYEEYWNYGSSPSATYTNLPHGQYTLLLNGANNDGVWAPAPLKFVITVLPPPWLTWWAYFIYVVVILAILALLIRFIVVRDRLKREKKVHQMKLDFFTNISHEFRTPLTLILGPLESILKADLPDMTLRKKISQAKFNADRLLRLVGELLDFRKTETGHMVLHVGKHNLIRYARSIFETFEEIAASKNVHYIFTTDKAVSELYFDDLQLEKVLFNLLSNAFKFTPSGGVVEFKIISREDHVVIDISNTGKGIALEDQSKIFTNFYHTREYGNETLGTGIGLALSKSILTLHHAEITFFSEPASAGENGLTNFSIKMKTGSEHFSKSELFLNEVATSTVVQQPTLSLTEPMNAIDRTKIKNILVVEDNQAIRQFIIGHFSLKFNMLEAENGEQGLLNAFQNIPDLIICDVMMPEMDGIHFTKILKLDNRTSHIPVILLTALSDNTHRISGLQTGADLYLTKPFSLEVLELSINNLLAARETMRLKFSQELMLQPSNVAVNKTDEVFLSKLVKSVEENLLNETFSVDVLASELGMSRNILYKKIDALTNMSAHEFIKSIRLKRAAQLLETQQYAVYEIATFVGFSDAKYFSREFKKQFGVYPKDYKLTATARD